MLVAVFFLDLGFVFQRFDPLTESAMVTSEFSNEMLSGRWETRLTIFLDEISSGRWSIWKDNFSVMLEQPWSFLVGYGWMSNTLSGIGKTPHSEYILKLYETGLFGLMAFLAVLMVLLFRTRALIGRLSGSLRAIQLGYAFGLCGLTVAILAVQVPNGWPVIWAIIGVLLALQGHALDGATETDEVFGGDDETGRDFARGPSDFAAGVPPVRLPHTRSGASAPRPLSSRKPS